MDVVLPLPGATVSASSRSYSRHVGRRIVVKDCQSAGDVQEIRVCTNRTCRRQGSMQILETLTDLAPPNVSVKSSGCLGRCGAGPNLVALPAATLVAHCGTTARAAEVLVALVLPRGREGDGGGGGSNWDAIVNKSLEALALRNKARSEVVDKNNFSQAELFLSQAIELGPIGGVHIMYKERSLARLASGNCSGALEDAAQALALHPLYPEAYICQGDAFLAMNKFNSAQRSYSTALQMDPSLRRSKSFKARIANLEKLTAVNLP
ncbi:hypothetical protein EV1_039154 [Malus domestica]|uniref:uncharacterized protein LOC126626070 n=1 Tax=Malus sylvestris TaxID=3752 RepID=UPI0021AD4918|nr:uncharacterized protein LOC126626070 [Malus sylvestris]